MNDAIITPEATVSAKAFGEEAPAKPKAVKVSWAQTEREFTVPVLVSPYYKADGKRGFLAHLDAGTFMCWPEGMPDGLKGEGTLVVKVPAGADTEPEFDAERELVKLPCRTKFVRFDA